MLDVRKFLLALFTDLAADKNYSKCFRAARKELHRFFWRIRQDDRRKVFVEALLFDTNGNYPHCQEIDELLQEFQLSGVLSRPNPTYKYNDIAITGTPSATEFKVRLSPEEKQLYAEILDEFKKELGVPSAE
jgi:hypothetical protein